MSMSANGPARSSETPRPHSFMDTSGADPDSGARRSACIVDDRLPAGLNGANGWSRPHLCQPCQAIAAARSGDTIQIDAAGNGTYDGDVCSWSTSNLTIDLVKSRAASNSIRLNRLTQQGGTGSYELDLPNAGQSYVVGNLLQQGPSSQNSNLFAYGEEGVTNPSSQLTIVNNTFVNDKGSGAAVVVGSQVTSSVTAQNNISTGSSSFVTQAGARLTTNCLTANPMFVDRDGFDYHLASGSPCIDAGSPPGTGGGVPGTVNEQYVYDLGRAIRPVNGAAIDAGAFER